MLTSVAHNSRNSSCSNNSVATATATEFDDDDELTDDYDSEWDDEERDDAAMDLALWYKATACIDPDIPGDE